MASQQSAIQELRTQLQASRWQMHDSIQRLEDQFNVPRRIKTQVAEHPMKWAVIAVGVGMAVAKVTPWLLRAGSRKWVRNLAAPALRMAAMAAVPYLARVGKPGLGPVPMAR